MHKTIHHSIDRLANIAIDAILPSRCPSCGEIVKIERGLHGKAQSGFCSSCWADLKFITPPWCISCALPFAYDEAGNSDDKHNDDLRKCGACLKKQPIYDGIRAALIYDEIPRKVVLKLKYGGRIAVADLIAGHLQRFLPDDLAKLGDDVWIAPVPLHWTRLLKRTYNQSALIGDALMKNNVVMSERNNMRHIVDLLNRIKRTPPLKGGNAKQRQKLLKNAFAVHKKYKNSIKGRSIILVDDVYTSGATTNACAKALKDAGADKVIIYCWTRVIK